MARRAEVISVTAEARTEEGLDIDEYVTSGNYDAFGPKYSSSEAVAEGIEHGAIDVLLLHLGVEFVKKGGDRIYRTGDSLGGVTILTGTEEERAAARKYVRYELTQMANELAAELSRNDGIPKTQFLALAKRAIDDAADNGSGKAE